MLQTCVRTCWARDHKLVRGLATLFWTLLRCFELALESRSNHCNCGFFAQLSPQQLCSFPPKQNRDYWSLLLSATAKNLSLSSSNPLLVEISTIATHHWLLMLVDPPHCLAAIGGRVATFVVRPIRTTLSASEVAVRNVLIRDEHVRSYSIVCWFKQTQNGPSCHAWLQYYRIACSLMRPRQRAHQRPTRWFTVIIDEIELHCVIHKALII